MANNLQTLLERIRNRDTLILMKAKDALPKIVVLENDPDKVVQISVQRAKKVLL